MEGREDKRGFFEAWWWRWLLLIGASAVAHLWCVKSQFYLDDLWQIRDSGTFHGDGHTEGITLRWFYLMLQVQVGLFGMSSPAIHVGNWLLHTGVALMLWRLALLLLPGRQGVALWSALLFAVHPLGSEIPNYARCQDIAWVVLFSLAACHQLAAFFRNQRWWHLLLVGVMITGATFAKGPGLSHALMMVGGLGACLGLPLMIQRGKMVSKVVWIGVGLLAVVVVLLCFYFNWRDVSSRWKDPRMMGHAFTLSRVFWEFCRLGFWPKGLCTDHHIEETLVSGGFWQVKDSDSVAWWAMVGMVMLALLSIGMMIWKKSRIVGLCLGLFVGAILMRFAFVVPEFMPEYRIYPGLPWFCLGVGIMLAAAWRWMTEIHGGYVAAVLLLVLAVLSAKRSRQWHSMDALMADVLEQYPTNARAIWVLQRQDLETGDWQAVIERHKKLPEITNKLIRENERLKGSRELPTGHHALAEVGSTVLFARAVAELHGADQGLKVINALEIYMKMLGISPETNLEHWLQFRRGKAWMLYRLGRYQEAYDLLHDIAMADSRLLLKEIEAKLSAQSSPSGRLEK